MVPFFICGSSFPDLLHHKSSSCLQADGPEDQLEV